MKEIAKKKQTFINKQTAKVDNTLPSFEKLLWEKIEKLTQDMATEGNLSAQVDLEKYLSRVQKILEDAQKESGYLTEINSYLRNFDEIISYNQSIQRQANNLFVPKKPFNQLLKLSAENAYNSLVTGGLNETFTQPVKDILLKSAYGGASIQSARNEIASYLRIDVKSIGEQPSASRLEQYITQVSRDSIHQFDGAINQNISNEYGLNGVGYVGSLLKDSRAQCQRWVGMEKILLSELEKEIRWAFSNGSGMIAGTDKDSFLIRRGGWNCRHQAIPIRIDKK